jgi:hypothetical protein
MSSMATIDSSASQSSSVSEDGGLSLSSSEPDYMPFMSCAI